MKKLLLLFFLLPISLSAQEKYFHELKGMEDSTGNTHLFYRMHEKTTFQCSELNGGELITNTNNNVNHFNTKTLSDTVKFRDYYGPWCLPGYISYSNIISFNFLNNDFSKFVLIKGEGAYDWQPPFISNYQDSTLGFPYPIIIKQSQNHNYGFPKETFITSDSIYLQLDNHTVSLSIDAKQWPKYGYDYDKFIFFLDSVSVQKQLSFIHPKIDSLFFFLNANSHLYMSEKRLEEYILSNNEWNFLDLSFDADSSIVYAMTTRKENNQQIRALLKSDNFSTAGSWETLSLPEDLNRIEYVVTDSEINGSLFVSDNTAIFKSLNYGNSFELLLEMDYRITGLYKKPNSDILFVLTTDELFEVNTESKEVTSLKKLPVSNEEPKEVPNSISLHQNYPNPFNPSTTISFELDKPAEVTLTVFDALGRTVVTLVNETRSIGTHSVNFDASNLSSGIYLYRLEAGDFIETKRLTLIK